MLDGALRDRDMPPFRRFLTEADVEALRAYLLWKGKTGSAAASRCDGHAQ